MIRRLLRPLRGLTEAVEGLGNGELGRQVPAGRRRDELGDLARAFNAMSTRLKDMVRGREQLLLDVSHELRSPLTRIKVALEMAPEGGAKDSIRDDLGEMDAMIGEILEAARLDSAPGRLNPEPVDLAELAGEAAGEFAGRGPGVVVAAAAGGRPEGAGGQGARPQGAVQRDRERGEVFPRGRASRRGRLREPPGRGRGDRSGIAASASRPPTCRGSSSPSTGWTAPAPGIPAGTGWA